MWFDSLIRQIGLIQVAKNKESVQSIVKIERDAFYIATGFVKSLMAIADFIFNRHLEAKRIKMSKLTALNRIWFRRHTS
jgi:type III secretory pathway component EscU